MTKKLKLRLGDLERLSKENAARRQECLRSLSKLPIGHTAEDIRRSTESYPPLLDEIIVAGARVLAADSRRSSPSRIVDLNAVKRERAERAVHIAQAAREIVTRVEIGSRVVEMLDSIQIGGKMLGDCTRAEVVAEAEREDRRSKTIAARIKWLRSLAEVIHPHQTVRTADRTAVLAILQEAP